MTTTRSGLLSSQYSIRRRHNTSVDNTLKELGTSFLYLFDQSPSQDHRQALKESEEAIKQHYTKIHYLIDSID